MGAIPPMRKTTQMTKPFTKAQSKDIAEKAAIIANTAFGLGRDAERSRILGYIKSQQCLEYQENKNCEHDGCMLLGDLTVFANDRTRND